MTSLQLSDFYPDDIILCENDLPFEDGTYEVFKGDYILNIFLIKNHRIQYHIVYNIELKKRLITWYFEYLTINNKQVHNLWRQLSDTTELDMWYSNHFELYPEHYNKKIECEKNFNEKWDKFINFMIECSINDINIISKLEQKCIKTQNLSLPS
jgi:hypothetical protein